VCVWLGITGWYQWYPQVLVAIAMTKHHGPGAVASEVALVLLCLKAAVDLVRLARGAKHDPGAPVNRKTAIMIGKAIERVLESIPGSVLQAVTLLNHADARTPLALGSICFACLATAFFATTLAYNFDTDPEEQRRYPAFYGCVRLAAD
jgi:hypothetical protein